MTKTELTDAIVWDRHGMGRHHVFMSLFGKEVPFTFFAEDPINPEVSDKMFETMKEVMTLPLENIKKIKQLLWEECTFSFQVADYGCEVKDDETALQAHLREFEIADKEDAYQKSNLKEIQIHYESDELIGRYAIILMESAADNLIDVIVKNGTIVDYDDNGTYLGWFEEDEQYAKKKRHKVIKE